MLSRMVASKKEQQPINTNNSNDTTHTMRGRDVPQQSLIKRMIEQMNAQYIPTAKIAVFKPVTTKKERFEQLRIELTKLSNVKEEI